MILRDYQIDAVLAEEAYEKRTTRGNPLIAMPTGTGKAAVNAALVKKELYEFPSNRVLCMTHVQELIAQNEATIKRLWPLAPCGVVSAGLNRKEYGFPITLASIQTVVRHPELLGYVNKVIVDEAHLISPKEDTSYVKVIDCLYKINPNLRVIGLTATPYRLGLGMLTEGGIFDDICFDITSRDAFNKLIERGFLSRLVPKCTGTQLDVEGVKTVGGEFAAHDLQLAVDKDALTEAIVREIVERGRDRKHWLIFAAGLDHARHVVEHLEHLGVTAEMVDGKMDSKTREDRLSGFKEGRYHAMVNNSVLTTGFDFPAIDLIAMLRPTKSPGLLVQCLGRGTRVWPGKENCLVLDFARNTERLGPINDPVIPSKKKDSQGGGKAPVRLCGECGSYCHASLKICPDCGAEFPENLGKFSLVPSNRPLIAETPEEIVWHVPVNVYYEPHFKVGKPTSMMVTYCCGLNGFQVFHEYIHFELPGWSRRKAEDWWRLRSSGPCPETTEVALLAAIHLPKPSRIKVNMAPKHPEILRAEFPINLDLGVSNAR